MQGKAQFGKYQVIEKAKFMYASSDRFDEQVDRLRAIRFGNLKYIRNFNLRLVMLALFPIESKCQ